MLKFFYNAAPNPMKVALLLEELGTSYEAIPIDTRKGEQFAPEFLTINPNAKVQVDSHDRTRARGFGVHICQVVVFLSDVHLP